MLSAANRRISDLLRASSPDLPASLARDGLAAALRGLIATDFSAEFGHCDWQIDPEAEEHARALQPLTAEAVYFAARELVRNAARYGRGAESGGILTLTTHMDRVDSRLRPVIQDNGIGLGSRAGGDALIPADAPKGVSAPEVVRGIGEKFIRSAGLRLAAGWRRGWPDKCQRTGLPRLRRALPARSHPG